jgi:hypothetical protein
MPLIVTTEEDEVETRQRRLGGEVSRKNAMHGETVYLSVVYGTSDLST